MFVCVDRVNLFNSATRACITEAEPKQPKTNALFQSAFFFFLFFFLFLYSFLFFFFFFGNKSSKACDQ